ncbi:MAG: GtrA family protein [Gemmiger sp.]|uniref:GtrA family protein n=1 Tax=Gemmiger sp. TaxID=2049027 RepID=UPI002E78DE26|nr:GtrA family protein [Gemmiger sp.]MEE0801169.1 GtrA family protein [Gemmiger sp.]
MEKIKAWILKYYEGLAYLFFGGLATLLNLVLFAAFQALLGTDFATGIGNILDNVICILFAYWTNRVFVFRSKNTGWAAVVEFGQFISCRLITLVMDQCIIWLGVNLLGPHIGFAVAHVELWAMGVKFFSQAIVILSNYVFSKVLIFKKK